MSYFDTERDMNDIVDILMHADAITCTPNVEEIETLSSQIKAYKIPYSHSLSIDYRRMAAAILWAGYRKNERKTEPGDDSIES